jgi:hypothetical protein
MIVVRLEVYMSIYKQKMLFQFPPVIEAGLGVGKYAQVFSNGVPIGMVRDAETGRFAAHAIGAAVGGNPLAPLVAPLQFAIGGVNIIQTQMGFQESYRRMDRLFEGLQSLKTSVGILQSTTAFIGVGTVASVALGAVNLHQTLKLKQDVKEMRAEMKEGFIDLKQTLVDMGAEVKEAIAQLATDVKFEQHRVVLIRAYRTFITALDRLRSAMQLQDLARRNAEIDSVRGMLFAALGDYDNPYLMGELSAPGLLRRFECVWAIEQAIAITYQIQNETIAASDRLGVLRHKIAENTGRVVEKCNSWDVLDFIFPELTRIRHHDLALVEVWENRLSWEPGSIDIQSIDREVPDWNLVETEALAVPPEQVSYELLSEKSHFASLQDQLKLMFQPTLRRKYEEYIEQKARAVGHSALVSSNLGKASDLAIANLYYYFQSR